MAQPTFFLQPLAAAISFACFSTVSFAAQLEHSTTRLAPIVVNAQLDHDANGLILHADPKQPIQPVPATDGADYLQKTSFINHFSINLIVYLSPNLNCICQQVN